MTDDTQSSEAFKQGYKAFNGGAGTDYHPYSPTLHPAAYNDWWDGYEHAEDEYNAAHTDTK